ncbi:MAG: ABC transporter ATP-binding protein [Lentisphaerae bacterium]|nr:ABC transporter ATP-binding protein [Lentisphaerota bacterium]
MSSKALYQLQDVTKNFYLESGVIEVLRGLTLEIASGAWVALVGRSGSGKTTLLHLLGGLDKPTAGRILLDGNDITRMSAARLTSLRRKRIGFVFQSYHLFPELSAWENAVLPALHWGSDRNAAYQNARQWLHAFGLGERLQHRPRELSGGEQQRVAIARALINDPDIILADEPTGNLDATAAQGIIDILKDVRQKQGKTLIMVTHDQQLAKQADRVIRLTDGPTTE